MEKNIREKETAPENNARYLSPGPSKNLMPGTCQNREPDTEERDQRIDFLRRKIKEDGIEAAVPGSGPDPLQSRFQKRRRRYGGSSKSHYCRSRLGADIRKSPKDFM